MTTIVNNMTTIVNNTTTIVNNTTTIVSSFIPNVNNRTDIDIDTYITVGKRLINIKSNKIIFTEQWIIDKYNLQNNENTIFINENKNDMYLWKYKNTITNFKLNTDNPNKDTLDYCIIMCLKTEWILKTININPFNTNNFVWMDFGINHIFKGTADQFEISIQNLLNSNLLPDKIRIGYIWEPSFTVCEEYLYNNITWYFAGGVFGGDINSLIKFAALMRKKCIEIITNKKTLIWEVNIWRLIYLENPELFDIYHCNHNNTLITNY